jgi:hypothetical protein
MAEMRGWQREEGRTERRAMRQVFSEAGRLVYHGYVLGLHCVRVQNQGVKESESILLR